MNIIEMFADYCQRSKTMTIEQLIVTAQSNHILVDDDCFIVFATVLDEIHILFAYAAKGKSIKPIEAKLANDAKEAGFQRMKNVARRDKAFARLFPDYKPIGVLFEKELI